MNEFRPNSEWKFIFGYMIRFKVCIYVAPTRQQPNEPTVFSGGLEQQLKCVLII